MLPILVHRPVELSMHHCHLCGLCPSLINGLCVSMNIILPWVLPLVLPWVLPCVLGPFSTAFTMRFSSYAPLPPNDEMTTHMMPCRHQVDGCDEDLLIGDGAKRYNIKNRVCESHLKAFGAHIKGQLCRYCQQVGGSVSRVWTEKVGQVAVPE